MPKLNTTDVHGRLRDIILRINARGHTISAAFDGMPTRAFGAPLPIAILPGLYNIEGDFANGIQRTRVQANIQIIVSPYTDPDVVLANNITDAIVPAILRDRALVNLVTDHNLESDRPAYRQITHNSKQYLTVNFRYYASFVESGGPTGDTV